MTGGAQASETTRPTLVPGGIADHPSCLLVRLGQVRARQAEPFGEITIDKSTLIVGGPADAAMPDEHTENPEPAND